jgi:hypothetical protein
LVKLRDKIEGRRSRPTRTADPASAEPVDLDAELPASETLVAAEPEPMPEPERSRPARSAALSDDSLVNAKALLGEALDDLVDVLRTPDAVRSIPDVDRSNLAKYLTIAKLRLENAIAIVRSGEPGE